MKYAGAGIGIDMNSVCLQKSNRYVSYVEKLLPPAVGILPLIFWPNLEHSFVTPKLIVLGAISLLSIILLSTESYRKQLGEDFTDWPILLWGSLICISSCLAALPSVEALWMAIIPIPIYFSIRFNTETHRGIAGFLRIASTILALISLLQYFNFDIFRLCGWIPESFPGSRMRVYGTMGNPNFVSAWLIGTLPLYLANERSDGKGASRWKHLALFILQIAALAATGSRSFILALPFLFLCLPAIQTKRDRIIFGVMLVLAALFLLRFSPGRSLKTTIDGRMSLNRMVLQQSRYIPIFGYGPGSYRYRYAYWLQKDAAHDSKVKNTELTIHAHNDYFEFGVEYGWAGLLAFAWIFFLLAKHMFAIKHGEDSVLCSASSAGLMSMAAVALVDFPFHRPSEWGLFWILAGMAYFRRPRENTLQNSP
jgi:putative inorganic carbon (hco3(-)) transporter